MVLSLWPKLQQRAKSFCRKAAEQERTADFDKVFEWTLDYTLYQIKGYFRLCTEADRVKLLVDKTLWRRLSSELNRRLRRSKSAEPVEEVETHSVGSIEEEVSALSLQPEQEELLLRVMYKRDGERLGSLWQSEAERKQWFRLRSELVKKVGGGR